jgi:hypothetical protein
MRLLDCSLKLSVESSDKRRESEPVTYEPESLGIGMRTPFYWTTHQKPSVRSKHDNDYA